MGVHHSKSSNSNSNSNSDPPQQHVASSDNHSQSSSLQKTSNAATSYTKEVAAYQSAVYGNPRPSHAILNQLHMKVHGTHHTQYSDDIKAPSNHVQKTYANSIAILTSFWENNVNTLSDNEYDALAMSFFLNAYDAMPDAQHIFKTRMTNDASTQSKIFFGAFGWLVNEVSQPDANDRLIRKLSILGQLHQDMGVILPYYLKMGGAFHQTMQDKFEQRYTLRVRFCFNTLYEIVVYIMLGLDFRSKCTQQRGKIAAFMNHINDLQSCLDDADTFEYLTLFMKQRLCDELALYYKDYKAYKCCTKQHERDAKGQEMKRLYISPSSEREINISCDRRKAFDEALSCKGYDEKLFDAISDDVMRLIRDSCFHAFRSEIQRVYKEMQADTGKDKKHSQAYSQNWDFLVDRLAQTSTTNSEEFTV